jgi:metal-responsive CopG/Arc/MetJ family transcriptional regulator
MKAIQITVDDSLLARLDRDPEVKRLGRSAVLRRATEAYLRDRRKADLADAYRRAYRGRRADMPELEGWADEGVWPER